MNLGLASGTYAFPFFRDFETSGSNQMLDPPTIETFAVPFRRFVKKFSEKALLGRKGTPELEVRFTGLFDGAFTIVSRTTIQDCSAPAIHGPIYREPMSLSRLRDHPEYLHKSQSLKPQHKRIRLATVRISTPCLPVFGTALGWKTSPQQATTRDKASSRNWTTQIHAMQHSTEPDGQCVQKIRLSSNKRIYQRYLRLSNIYPRFIKPRDLHPGSGQPSAARPSMQYLQKSCSVAGVSPRPEFLACGTTLAHSAAS